MGFRPKQVKGDCVVVNFDSAHIPDRLFWDGSEVQDSGQLRAVPLGFFYPPQLRIAPTRSHYNIPPTAGCVGNNWQVVPFRPRQNRSTVNIAAPTLMLANRFTSLTDLNQND